MAWKPLARLGSLEIVWVTVGTVTQGLRYLADLGDLVVHVGEEGLLAVLKLLLFVCLFVCCCLLTAMADWLSATE